MQSTLVFPKIMTALDLSDMDRKLIAYSLFMAKNADAKSLHFIHVIPNFILPESADFSFQKVLSGKNQVKQWAQRQLAKAIHPAQENLKEVEINVAVPEGNPLEQLWATAQELQPDLLIVGKKTLSANSGIIARRIARKTECAVCFVTEAANADVKRVLVPVDFSDTSARALQAAIQLQTQLGNVQIIALHVIEIPMVAYKINRNQNEIIARLEQGAEKGFSEFLKKNNLKKENIELAIAINDELNISGYIMKTAAEQDANLIIIGAKCQSIFEDLIFGSTTEKLVTLEVEMPILVIR